MLSIKEIMKRLEEDETYSLWRKEHGEAPLVHIFSMYGTKEPYEFHIGFYNRDETVTTFIVSSESVQKLAADNVLAVEGKVISELKISEVLIEISDALDKADTLCAKNKAYAKENITKKIVILQFVDGVAAYNITLVSSTYNIINIRIDAKKGEILKDELVSMMSFIKQDG